MKDSDELQANLLLGRAMHVNLKHERDVATNSTYPDIWSGECDHDDSELLQELHEQVPIHPRL